jgi:hypothetical protein
VVVVWGLVSACSPSLSDPALSQEESAARSLATTELMALAAARGGLLTGDLVALGIPTASSIPIAGLCRADSTGSGQANAAGVPQDLTLTWPADRCVSGSGLVARNITGSVRLQDLGGRYAARVTYADYDYTVTFGGGNSRQRVNGVAEIRAVDDTTGRVTLQTTESVEVVGGGGVIETTRAKALAIGFVDAAGVPRPPFSVGFPNRLTYDGTMSVVTKSPVRDDSVFLRITTPVAMEPDVGCFLSGYRAGEISAQVTGRVRTTVTLRYRCQ